MSIQLFKGDCIKLMQTEIDPKSIDLILVDLPYGTTQCKWDIKIPFNKLWMEFKRIIKDKRAIALFGSEPFSSLMVASNLENFKYQWEWIKEQGTGFQVSKYRPMIKNESISIFAYETPVLYHPPKEALAKPKVIKRKKGSNGKSDSSPLKYANEITSVYTHKTPENLLFYKRDKGLHSTQKPVKLLEYLIQTYSNEGDLVLDCCMGSGSTGIACLNTGRSFIGMEKDEDIFSLAKERIENHVI
jgi:site-specific DNA-methyltransferase (adenine-specific)